jgi:hypothetical protein
VPSASKHPLPPPLPPAGREPAAHLHPQSPPPLHLELLLVLPLPVTSPHGVSVKPQRPHKVVPHPHLPRLPPRPLALLHPQPPSASRPLRLPPLSVLATFLLTCADPLVPHLHQTQPLLLPPHPASAGPEPPVRMAKPPLPHLVADTSPHRAVVVPPLAVLTDVVVSAADPRGVSLDDMNRWVDVVVSRS